MPVVIPRWIHPALHSKASTSWVPGAKITESPVAKGRARQSCGDGRKVYVASGPKVDPADKLPDGRAFDGYDQFKKLLMADKDQVARCVTEKLLVYATGCGLDFADRPVVDALLASAAKK